MRKLRITLTEVEMAGLKDAAGFEPMASYARRILLNSLTGGIGSRERGDENGGPTEAAEISVKPAKAEAVAVEPEPQSLAPIPKNEEWKKVRKPKLFPHAFYVGACPKGCD